MLAFELLASYDVTSLKIKMMSLNFMRRLAESESVT